MFELVREAYLRTGSIGETVRETGENEYRVRRALITMGLWESDRSQEVKALMGLGLSKQEIADKLCLSVKGVESYLPYDRGAYLLDETQDSADSRNYRERNRSAASRQVRGPGKAPGRDSSEQSEPGGGQGDGGDMEGPIGWPDGEGVYLARLGLSIPDLDCLDALRALGRAREGISRTVLVPSSMQLNRLNYAIQKCFGWENSHLHRFVLGDEDFKRITGNDLEKWKSLAGKVFRCHFADGGGNDDYYYLDDYDGSCSFKTWLKRKYAMPYNLHNLYAQF